MRLLKFQKNGKMGFLKLFFQENGKVKLFRLLFIRFFRVQEMERWDF